MCIDIYCTAANAADAPMETEDFMRAVKMVPRTSRASRNTGNPLPAKIATPAGRHASAIVSPSTVDEGYWLGDSVTPRQSKSADGRRSGMSHRKGETTGSKRKGRASEDKHAAGTPKTVPKTVPGGKRRRCRTTAAVTEEHSVFQSPPAKSSTPKSVVFFSPGQEAAKSLLALRKGFFYPHF